MASKWYPVIDYVACVECGICSNFCPHGVYDKSKSPTPVVVNPNSCIDHCHGCQNQCPVGAISYVGDDGNSGVSGCGCGCGDDNGGSCCG
jgi:NAD-dependent dihydropyrimidine dehydrogenase PreA subunit